jgi:hypothetical protein
MICFIFEHDVFYKFSVEIFIFLSSLKLFIGCADLLQFFITVYYN